MPDSQDPQAPVSRPDPSVRRLFERACAGDREAFAALIAPHLATLNAYARAICGDAATADDVVQETLLVAMAKLAPGLSAEGFPPWLKVIVRRQALSARRSSLRRRLRVQPCVMAELEAVFALADEDLEAERRALRECLATLSRPLAQAVDAFYRGGRSVLEIATALADKETTVRTRLHRARQILRTCVERRLRGEP